MKIDPVNLGDLIEKASVWSSGGTIEPILFNFEDGVKQAQFNKPKTIFSVLEADEEFFDEYEEMGEVQVPPDEVMKYMKSFFGVDKQIDFTVDGEKLKLSGKRDELKIEIPDEELTLPEHDPVLEGNGKPEKVEIIASYLISSNEIKNIPDVDIYRFNFGEDFLKVSSQKETLEAERELKLKEKDIETSGVANIDSEFLEPCLSQFSGNVWIHFGSGDQVILAQKGSEITWSYTIAGREVE